MTKRDAALWYFERMLFHYYRWRGDDPSGWDCSGATVESLQASGVLPRGDWSADMLLDRGWTRCAVPTRGCLAFRLNSSGDAVHVGMVWNVLDDGTILVIQASGGDSETETEADAIKANAFVKLRPVWSGAVYADPFAVPAAGDV